MSCVCGGSGSARFCVSIYKHAAIDAQRQQCMEEDYQDLVLAGKDARFKGERKDILFARIEHTRK